MAARKSAKDVSDERVTVQVALLPQANLNVSEWCDRSGMSKAKFLQRLVEWFAIAPPEFQQMIVGLVPLAHRKIFAKESAEFIDHWVQTGNWQRNAHRPDRLAAISQLDHQAPAPRPAPHGK